MGKIKNTRLVYTDKDNLMIYENLPDYDFKEFFMKYFTYNLGDEVKPSDFTNPLLYSLFMSFKQKIDFNEEKWLKDKRKETSKENGKKGGRPRNNNKL